MGAPDVLARLSALGVRLTREGEAIRAAPRSALTDEIRVLIRAHKAEILVALREPANDLLPDPAMEPRRQRVTPEVELTALVNLIADHHGFTPSDRQEALEIALADAVSALECFRALAARLPGRTAEGSPC